MSWRVSDLMHVAPEGVVFGEPKRHVYHVRFNGALAPLTAHEAERTEIPNRHVRKFWTRLGLDPDEMMGRTRKKADGK